MIKKLQLACAFLFLASIGAFAQQGSIKGKIFDKATKEPLAFASVVAEMGGAQKGGAQSDFDGEYNIKPLQAGEYTIRISYVGYNELVITGVIVSGDNITFKDLAVSKMVIEHSVIEIEAYQRPLINKGNPSIQSTATKEDIEAAVTRDVRAVAAQTAGVFQRDDGDDVNVRGSRSGETNYFVDGIRIRGLTNLPKAGVEQISVISGGIPAQYGDVTGGVINITTRGPEQEFGVGVNLETSELFDKFGHNLASLSLSGPILSKKNADGSKKSILGFFVAADYTNDVDPDPSGIGMYKLKGNLFDDLVNNPLQNVKYTIQPNGTKKYSSTKKGQYYHADSFEKIKIKQNTGQGNVSVTAKIDFQPDQNNIFTVGGNLNRQDKNVFNIDRALYNYNENPQQIDLDWRAFARYTKKIGNSSNEDNKSASLLKNTYFSIQAEYTVNKRTTQDEAHKNNFWNYGYRGKLVNNITRVNNPDPNDLKAEQGWYVYGPNDSAFYNSSISLIDINHYYYTPTGLNPYAEAYTINGLLGSVGFNDFQQETDITDAGGLLNGQNPSSINAEWQSVGAQFNRYTITNNDAYRFVFSGNTDIKNHAITLGLEFEQRIDRTYDMFPNGLWTSGSQFSNQFFTHVAYLPVGSDSLIRNFTPAYNTQAYKSFYERIRDRLGMNYDQRLDFSSLSPEQLNAMSLDLFTPDQLILTTQIINTYAGYDYTGKKLGKGSRPTFSDFWNKKVNGSYSREVDAFRPVYMAGYIQDNFSIDNLVFNVGVRVDRFDANQVMLKDKYSLYAVKTAGEVSNLGAHPDNIKDSYVIYVDDPVKPTKILGYRDKNVWYDTQGRIVSDPDFLAKENSGNLYPYLVYPDEAKSDGGIHNVNGWDPSKSFKDYEPQYSVMPRIAFTFPISDVAMFFAHYDVLSSRPAERLRLDPVSYIQSFDASSFINNPNLKPEKTTNYELGFKQVLSKSSALSLSAFYIEKKNLIQVVKVPYAYPVAYTTYDNIDFANIKGFTLGFDLRRTGNIRMTANYTLQFADGTGSGVNSSLELAQTDQPNIRLILPLDFDQRHLFTMNFDYRYGKGSGYNGPIVSKKQIFSNTGLSMQLKAGSGTPYTRQSRPTPEAAAIGWQSNGQRAVEGEVNGARLPWTFSVDFKIDKDFEIKVGDKKSLSLNVYFQMQNALDIRNVTQVYRVTGNAKDDGFINSADGILASSTSVDQQAYKDQYSIKLQNPNYYTIPRRSRIGISVNF